MARITIRNRSRSPIQFVTETGVRSPQGMYDEVEPNQELELEVEDEGEIAFAALPYPGAVRNSIDIVLQWFTTRGKMRHRIQSRSMRIYTQIYRHAEPVIYELRTRNPVFRLLRVAVPLALITALVVTGILLAQSSGRRLTTIAPSPVPTGEPTFDASTETPTATLMPTATLVSTATSAPQPTVTPVRQPTHIPPPPPTRTPVPPTSTPVPPTSTPVPQPLNVAITQPTNGTAIPFYTTTTFLGNASDPNNGANLTGNALKWVASQGSVTVIIGNGVSPAYSFDGATWGSGNVTITLYATDPANGLSNQTQITISLYYAE